ncbi:LLM class flavin-dependent oxidoreductase [Bacillus licheniformis]|nr:LLM class flavin-dependent oxidoreductase [Bacillus licheniformis]
MVCRASQHTGLASTAPEIMIAHIAAKTANIRVGSGGVLLPQYSPFKVAETFGSLKPFIPGELTWGSAALREAQLNEAGADRRGS